MKVHQQFIPKLLHCMTMCLASEMTDGNNDFTGGICKGDLNAQEAEKDSV